MGIELMEIGIKLRKGAIFTVKWCFRSVCSHPFFVGMLCFLIFLYRLSPFIFSFLVSASPVLVCTAVLLGTLLSFGQPNIPEIEIEEKTTYEAVSIKTGVSGDATVVEKNESFYVERFSEKRRDEAEESTEQRDLPAGKLGEVCRENGSDDTAPLIEERSREIELNDGEMWEAERGLGDLGYKEKAGWNEEILDDGEVGEKDFVSAAKVNDEVIESDDEKSEADSFDSEKVNVDSLDSPPRSPWTRVEERREREEEAEDEDEEDGDLDSDSDRAESSSPDASMADIIPMLDELHPLLDEEAPQPVHVSRDGSDVASERSPKSSTRSHESDDETENQEDLEAADDDNEDEEDGQGDKEEQTKSAITWTEEDQKNLMDLGSSEIERNQRLENLILRRRARKTMGIFPERNLIDLESADLPFNITPISTRRQNPFDLPQDSYDDSGLPPIPGSAPSILLPRRNPFDIPYDSSEEKPDLMGDGFQEEFTSTLQSREPFFRRHESFSVRPSIFAPSRQDVKMRPYFVPERTFSEESSYSSFQRQLSELSDSKVSSVPETESIGSVEDLQDRKLAEEDNRQEVEAIPSMEEITEEREEDLHREPEPVPEMASASEHVGHGSQSSEEEDSLELGQVEKKDVEVDELHFQLEDVAYHYQQENVTRPVEVQATEYHSNSEAVEQRCSRDSSSSSLSEVSERVFSEMVGETLPVLEEGRQAGAAGEPGISTQTSVESTDLNITSTLVSDIPNRGPVYDSSPRGVGNNLSSSSSSLDVHPESDLGLPSVLVKRTVSFLERESEESSQEIVIGISSTITMLPESSVAHPAYESRAMDAISIREHDNVSSDSSEVHVRPETEGSSAAPSIIPDVSILSKSSVEASVEENPVEQHSRAAEAPISSASSEDQNLDQPQEDKYSLVSERANPIEVSEPRFESEAELLISMDEILESPNSGTDVYCGIAENLNSTPYAEGNESVFYDKAMDEPILEHLSELQASSSPVESPEVDLTTQESKIPQIQELDHDFSSNVTPPLIPDFISFPPSASETTSSRIVEEADEIKEIDEGLLSELDNVGDFSIKQWGSGSSEFKKHVDPTVESLPSAYHAETSSTSVAEVDLVDVNETEAGKHSENSREDIHVHEEDMVYISELQTSETSIVEQIDAPKPEFNERDGQDSPDGETSEDDTLSKENEVQPVHFVVNHNYEDNVSGISEVEVRSMEDVDSVPKKAEFMSMETEVLVPQAEVSYHVQVDMDKTSWMPELEASTIKDMDLALKQISSEEIEEPVVLEPPPVFDADTTTRMPELEASSIEDIDLAFKQISAEEIEKPVVLERTPAELIVDVDTTSRMPELEASSIEDIDRAFKQIGAKEIEEPIVLEASVAEPVFDTDAASRMPELEASRIEDIDLAFKQISSEEIEKPVVLEPSQAEPTVGETITEHSQDEKPHRDSSLMGLSHETSILEVRPIEDVTLDHKQSNDCSTESRALPDSVNHNLNLVESEETQGTVSELHVAEPVPSEDTTTLHPEQVSDGNTEEQLKLNLDVRSVEVEVDNAGSSVESSTVEEVNVFTAEQPGPEVEAPKALHSTSSPKGKGKISKSSSSSSSSSSESSSSDSDRE
ncbi:hypothetical protein Salat_2922500 [Sesamum alatum]|uniref:Uncharacterized protein n=1 Tax=Sesamum alatum TaxID=300844 RepID=A0AAE1XJU2_9LAMI|nr:hypothetical protein Salat_2922500 [Sesamum alatum]